jgi:translation initiation factor IF-2
MSKVRVHQLAKELGIEPKELVARLEKIRVRGKKVQSSLEESEVAAIRAAIGAAERPKVTVGTEKVIVDRMITAEDQNRGEVQAHEKIVERRVKANVIRRRTRRVDVVTQQPLVPPVPVEETEEVAQERPETRVEETKEESLESAVPVTEERPAEAVAHREEVLPEPPLTEEVAETAGLELEQPEGVEETEFPTEEAAERREMTVEAPEEEVAAPEREEVAKAVEEPERPAMKEGPLRGPRVLGRIDLRSPAQREQTKTSKTAPEGTAAAPAARGEEASTEAEKPGKPAKAKKRVIRKHEVIELKEREFRSPRGRMLRKRRALPGKEQKKTEITVPKASKRVVRMSEVVTVGDMAKAMGVKAGEVIKVLMGLGMMATINQVLDFDTATLVGAEFEYQVENMAFDIETALQDEHEVAEPEESLKPRPPVVTIMGHVDHGKTSLLDAIRKTNVTSGEAGGITQHIGAYHVQVDGRGVTFLDTPGHEAFTAMRARAADDGVMPQTVEAINHARAAEVPIVVAVNKIDRPDADPERVQRGLSEHGLVPEAWGGDTIIVPVSALTGEGLSQLLEMLLLQADILELRANPDKLARGAVVEAKLERGRGPVSTVLVQEGTLKVGDPVVAGIYYGRVRAMIDDQGRKVDAAGPSMPVEILGLQGAPQAGEVFSALTDESKARQIAEHRSGQQRETELQKTSKVSLDEFYEQIKAGDVKELRVVLKADVHGSVEALTEAMTRLSTDDVKLRVIHGSVGGITESDVLLASASNAIVIGFNVRPEPKAAALAVQEKVDTRLYTVIYEVIEDITAAMEGLLEPVYREEFHGRAQVREIFNIRGVGTIAGCAVTDGKIVRSSMIRLLRDQVVVHEGRLSSLRRFKDDVREVGNGYECGLAIDGFNDIKVGDVIEAFERVAVERGLRTPARSGDTSQVSAGDHR